MPTKYYTPVEEQEQAMLFEWVELAKGKYPELSMMFAIPNGGYRHKATARAMKRQGVLAGVCDILLPVSRQGCHGLFVEMKRKGGRLQDNQLDFIESVRKQGYKAEVCYGFEEAKTAIEDYLR